MPSVCKFALDHPNGVYYSGQTVNGSINLTTTKDKNVRHVRIVFLGEGKVKWDECDSSTSNTTYYKSHEVYVESETHARGEGKLRLGLHTYTFSISLPVQCPTSCEGKYGHIRYGLSLILERPFRFNNVYHMPLTVLRTVDLNLNPTFKSPLLAEQVKSLRSWNLSSSNIIYTLRLPFGAYSPGQAINYSLCIQNQTKNDTLNYSLEFIQKMTFIAHSPSRTERHKKSILVQQNSSEKCLRLSKRIFEGRFRIPAVPPTTGPSGIICVGYTLKVTVRISGCHMSKDISVPIVVGTIPLRESLPSCHAADAHATPAPTKGPASSKEDNSNSDMPPSYQDLKPPSYEAAMQSDSPFVDDDVDKHHRVDGFRPLYPMFS